MRRFPQCLTLSVLAVWVGIAPLAPASAWTLNRGSVGTPTGLDPHLSRTVQDAMVAVDLAAGLTGWSGAGEAVPMLATDWTVNDDRTVWTFTLRPDARWSDGTPLTADDIVASFRRAVDPATAAPTADTLRPILGATAALEGSASPEALGVTAPAPDLVEIGLIAPTPWLPSVLAQPIARIVDPTGDRTSGPFRLVERTVGGGLRLERNPNFHGWATAEAAPTAVLWIPIEDPAAALRRFADGEIDHHLNAPLEETEALLGPDNPAIRRGTRAGIYSYTLNPAVPPLDDIRVRQALVLALDRDRLADLAFGVPSDRFIPPDTGGIGDTVSWEAAIDPLARLDEAEALAAAAGLDPAEPMTLTLKTMAGALHTQVAAAVADMWAPLGIRLEIETRDNAAHWGGLVQGEAFDIARTGWVADFDDATTYFAAVSPDSPYNFTKWTDPEFDRLLADASALTGAERAALLSEAEAILLADATVVPLFIPGRVELLSPEIEGWSPNSGLWLPSWTASKPGETDR